MTHMDSLGSYDAGNTGYWGERFNFSIENPAWLNPGVRYGPDMIF